MRHSRLIIPCLALLLCTACKDITQVQTGYVSDRDTCRTRSEDRLSLYNQPGTYNMSEKERNNAVLALFVECMREYGWNLGGKKDVKEVKEVKPTPPATPQQGTTVVVVQSPAAAPAIVNNTPAATPVACPAPPPVIKGKPVVKRKNIPQSCMTPEEKSAAELESILGSPK